ncbi:hypothetical protein BsWGS_00607 [Bradybaena similaris]
MIMTFVLAETATAPRNGYRRGVPCTTASKCGYSGCCLHGFCSRTGWTGQKCYENVTENGLPQYSGIWTKTDLCPCENNDYCYVYNRSAENVHPLYGPVGACHSILR